MRINGYSYSLDPECAQQHNVRVSAFSFNFCTQHKDEDTCAKPRHADAMDGGKQCVGVAMRKVNNTHAK